MKCVELKLCKHLNECKPISHNASAKMKQSKAESLITDYCDAFTIQGKLNLLRGI